MRYSLQLLRISGEIGTYLTNSHKLCFPRVSIGKRHMATNAARISDPAAYTGAFCNKIIS